LNEHERDQNRKKDRASDQIACIDHDVGLEPGHGDGVAAGLAERGGQDLDDPEPEGDLGTLLGLVLTPVATSACDAIMTAGSPPCRSVRDLNRMARRSEGPCDKWGAIRGGKGATAR
jgi:hypothetical protein